MADEELTDEEIEQIVIEELGRAFLHVIGASKRLGHVTLKGHLCYQHEQRGTIAGDGIGWLRYMIAHNKADREKIGYPEELGRFADLWLMNRTTKAIDGAMADGRS